jgi:ADP-ribose pyrophosphatase YjhB (NUDIX family)
MFSEKCGKQLVDNKCTCGFIKFHNPIPVAVAVVPVVLDGVFLGFLGVKRGIEPKKGEIAFPGGFQEIETIEQALLREVKEESDLAVELDHSFQSLVYSSEPNPNRLLVFLVTQAVEKSNINWDFKTEETMKLTIINEADSLAFPLHTKAKDFFFKLVKLRYF